MFTFACICIKKLWKKPITEITALGEVLLLDQKRTGGRVELFIV